MDQEQIRATWDEVSPFATAPAAINIPYLRTEGPVRFLLLSGELDDGSWGLVGAFWLSIDGGRGGFIVSPEALWRGSEMVRSYRGALARGWTEGTIYAYWDGLAGSVDTFMVDPSKQAESLFEVARLVEAI